jgi:hypothetical protein
MQTKLKARITYQPDYSKDTQELSPVFTEIFNCSLCHVPKIWMTSSSVPVAKKPAAKEHDNSRPVALIFCVIKSIKRLMLKHLLEWTTSSLPTRRKEKRSAYFVNQSTI